MDLLWDVNLRDLAIQNGDFVLTDNPSVQNASILKEARAFSPNNPTFGIGLMESINSPVSVLAYEMNRWISQVKSDGAQMIMKHSFVRF